MSTGKVHVKRVSIRKIRKIIDRYQPYGRFLSKDGSIWVAVDNSTGDAWTEDFISKRDAVRWLRGEFEVGGGSKSMEENSMKVLVVEPLKRPQVKEINGTLRAMQEIVGGTIQALYPFDDLVAIVANDEGKVLGLLPNRGLRDDAGELCDIICGTFFVCGLAGDSFVSLTDEQIEKYTKEYETPELFLRICGDIFALPLAREDAEKWRKEYDNPC